MLSPHARTHTNPPQAVAVETQLVPLTKLSPTHSNKAITMPFSHSGFSTPASAFGAMVGYAHTQTAAQKQQILAAQERQPSILFYDACSNNSQHQDDECFLFHQHEVSGHRVWGCGWCFRAQLVCGGTSCSNASSMHSNMMLQQAQLSSH